MSDDGTKAKRDRCLIPGGQSIALSMPLAILFGVTSAAILQQIHFWIDVKSRPRNGDGPNPEDQTFCDDRWWVYNSYSEWTRFENVPFRKPSAIGEAVRALEAEGIIVSQQMGGLDRRKWYTIDYDALHQYLRENWCEAWGEFAAPAKPVWWLHYTKQKIDDASSKKSTMEEPEKPRCNEEKDHDAKGVKMDEESTDQTPDSSSDHTAENGGANAPHTPAELTIKKLEIWAAERAKVKDKAALDSAIAAEKAKGDQARKGAIQVLEQARKKAGFSREARNAMSNALMKLCFCLEPDQFATLDSNSRRNLSKATEQWLLGGQGPEDVEEFGEWWYTVHLGLARDYKHPPRLAALGANWGRFNAWRKGRKAGGPPALPGDAPNGATKRTLAEMGIKLPGE